MIRLDCAQGSEAWFMARIGIPTASQFAKIITNKTQKLSEQSDAYAHKLLAEQILGVSLDGESSGFMERGQILEQQAVDYYELQRDCETEEVGFVLRDDRRVGCSPDRFVGEDGLLEIKCPAPDTHIGYLLDDDGIGYRAQTQGQLWICERQWIDTLSFHPSMPPALIRVMRDEEYIANLAKAVEQFLWRMDGFKQQLAKRGMFSGADSLLAERLAQSVA